MQFDFKNILFIDIETVPAQASYEQLDEVTQALWAEKVAYLTADGAHGPADLYERAGVMAEFGKIICISAGYFRWQDGDRTFRVKSFYSHSEREILTAFGTLLGEKFPHFTLCAHNGKEFDFPFTARRMLINGIPLPGPLQIAGKKPWEVAHLDTMEMWKFGDRKNFTSLKLLAHLFGIPTPKDDISGKDVARVYWVDDDLERIAVYCQKDVVALANLCLRWDQKEILSDDEIVYLP